MTLLQFFHNTLQLVCDFQLAIPLMDGEGKQSSVFISNNLTA